jgi:hypothetical protein
MSDHRIVGHFYMVPAVRVNEWWGFKGWLPVVGPKHSDAEIVKFPWPHFHVDWRFAPRRVFDHMSGYQGASYALGFPIQCPDSYGTQIIVEGPIQKRMKMKREQLPFPHSTRAKWPPELKQHFACAKLVNGLCPHRGIPVEAMHRDGDVLTCPGHGLRWNAITGEAIP